LWKEKLASILRARLDSHLHHHHSASPSMGWLLLLAPRQRRLSRTITVNHEVRGLSRQVTIKAEAGSKANPDHYLYSFIR
jgi:hypothetical protein